jgi:tetratricopeptide (TPR) repeat protein
MRVMAIGVCAAVLGLGMALVAQDDQSPQQLFEAGQHDDALKAIAAQRARGAAGPAEAFLAGQILLKAGQPDGARQEFRGLSALGDPTWTLVADASLALLDNDTQRALASAQKAAADAPGSFHVHYQLGLVKARFDDWTGCAEAFGRAAELNPTFAYAHYYAGLSYSRIRRADRTSEHFERFLKLAPKAPERAAIESLMRTLRGSA